MRGTGMVAMDFSDEKTRFSHGFRDYVPSAFHPQTHSLPLCLVGVGNDWDIGLLRAFL